MSVTLLGSGGQTVVQVVTNYTDTYWGNGTTDWISTPLTATITPRSTASQILIIIHAQINATSGGGGDAVTRILKNDTWSINEGFSGITSQVAAQERFMTHDSGMCFIDTTNTTSPVTYTLQARSWSGQAEFRLNNRVNLDFPCRSFITLMEIANN